MSAEPPTPRYSAPDSHQPSTETRACIESNHIQIVGLKDPVDYHRPMTVSTVSIPQKRFWPDHTSQP